MPFTLKRLLDWWNTVDNTKKLDPKVVKATDKFLFVGRGHLVFYEHSKNPDIKKLEIGDTISIDGLLFKVTGKPFGRSVEGGEMIFVSDFKL